MINGSIEIDQARLENLRKKLLEFRMEYQRKMQEQAVVGVRDERSPSCTSTLLLQSTTSGESISTSSCSQPGEDLFNERILPRLPENRSENTTCKSRRQRLRDTSWRKMVYDSQDQTTTTAAGIPTQPLPDQTSSSPDSESTTQIDGRESPAKIRNVSNLHLAECDRISSSASTAATTPSSALSSSTKDDSNCAEDEYFFSTASFDNGSLIDQEATLKMVTGQSSEDRPVLNPTSSEESSADRSRPAKSSLRKTEAPTKKRGEDEKKSSKKSRRQAFNLPRISTDSVDDYQQPKRTLERLTHSRQATSVPGGNGQQSVKKKKKKKRRNTLMYLGSHKVTIESPTSSESEREEQIGLSNGDSSLVSGSDDEDMISAKSSLSEPDDIKKHRISIPSPNEWLTDNEGYYEDLIPATGNGIGSPADDSVLATRLHEGASSGQLNLIDSRKFRSDGDIYQSQLSETSRQNVKMTIIELFETERNYISNLLTIMEVFSRPISEMGLLSRKVHGALFPSYILHLIHRHSIFLGKLEERIYNWHFVQRIGDLFAVFKEENRDGLFRVYLAYITHFPHMFDRLTKAMASNERFRQYVQRCRKEERACQRLSLLSFLYNPIQRVPRYVLLLKTYMKHLDHRNPDRLSVQSAVSSLNRLLFEANKLCNFKKDGSGAIKLPSCVPSNSSTPSIQNSTSLDSPFEDARNGGISAFSDVDSIFSNGSYGGGGKKQIQSKLSTVLNVFAFSRVLKKKKRKSAAVMGNG